MTRCILVALFTTALLAGVGCGGQDSATDVADNFWKAMEARDLEEAKSYATLATAENLQINEEDDTKDVEIILGDPQVDGEKTVVPTSISGTDPDNGAMTISMQTVLVKEDGHWRVDVDATMFSMFGGAMGEMMEQMGEAMQESMEEMGKAMGDAMQEGMKEMANAMEDAQNDD